tara:strand:- start:345 stop:1238 length:894 start_codon:yes stop_codon:yes gene_type:complete
MTTGQHRSQTGASANSDTPHVGTNNEGAYPNSYSTSEKKIPIGSMAAAVLILITLLVLFLTGSEYNEVSPESAALSSTVPQSQIKRSLTRDVFTGLKGPSRVMQAIYETLVLAESSESDALTLIRDYFPDPDEVVSGAPGRTLEELKVRAERFANSEIDDWIRIISKATEGISLGGNEKGKRIKWSEMEVLALIIDHAPSLDDDLEVEGDAVIFLARENNYFYIETDSFLLAKGFAPDGYFVGDDVRAGHINTLDKYRPNLWPKDLMAKLRDLNDERLEVLIAILNSKGFDEVSAPN